MKTINIGGNSYNINYSDEVAKQVLDEVIKWMEHRDHYASSCGESLMQNDNTIIDAPDLISDIVDNILKPKYID